MTEERRPILEIIERRPFVSALFGQRERGPIIGAVLRMRPEARGAFIRDMAIDTLVWSLGLGTGRILMRILEMNLLEFLGGARGEGRLENNRLAT